MVIIMEYPEYQIQPFLCNCVWIFHFNSMMFRLLGLISILSFSIRGVLTSHDVYMNDYHNAESLLAEGFVHELEEYDHLTRPVPESTLDIISSYLKLPPEVFKIEFTIPKNDQIEIDSMNEILSALTEVRLVFSCNSYTLDSVDERIDMMDIVDPDIVLSSRVTKKCREITMVIRSNLTVPDEARCADRLWVAVNFMSDRQIDLQMLLLLHTNSIQLTTADTQRGQVFSYVLRNSPGSTIVHFVETMTCGQFICCMCACF
eukprot:708691_1